MHASAEKVWARAQELLRSMVNPEIYRLWFAPIRARQSDERSITLEVANDFCGVWLKENYLSLIQDVLMDATGQPLRAMFQVADAPRGEPEPGEVKRAHARPPNGEAERRAVEADLLLNPKYTFETFVVGSSNHFAHAAAVAVAQSPGKAYNPLFVYGGTGLGKTHLLNAIGQYVAHHKKGARIAYVSSEKFTNEYIDALQNNQVMRFRRKYRQTDVLLIDDVQFLAGKERIQEEFFHTFNALHESHKQIVLSCDRPVSEIQNLEQRLVSRFEWGLTTDLQPPDVETRVAILRKKAGLLGVPLPEDVVQFLAGRIRTNVRRLEGALIRVASYVSLTGKPADMDLVENLLREVLHEEGRQTINIETIQKRVAEHFDIRLADMTSKRRPENIAFPRQIAMYLARQMTESSLSVIGEAFGGRDHGTVLHACRLVKDRMEVDANVRQVVQYLEKQLLR
ncbi:MAG TPA: chromosomal replication initiator protein DnaA [Candidatus Paceibacterota bacterium]|nr:chromosomal replication initiator protein DnaA [Verrucomicrobiota bacterium]HOX01233.1 chromosomal replication initiator protein DnaA [Verrucomicrobiota bacterium]HRZ46027.1 chromosomal replication initiator protein DnaA [Candidatus Paceibacterota bacterium]